MTLSWPYPCLWQQILAYSIIDCLIQHRIWWFQRTYAAWLPIDIISKLLKSNLMKKSRRENAKLKLIQTKWRIMKPPLATKYIITSFCKPMIIYLRTSSRKWSQMEWIEANECWSEVNEMEWEMIEWNWNEC